MLTRARHSLILACILLFGLVGTASALTVSPAKLEVVVDPGQTYRGEIELFNEQSEAKTFYSSFENFEPRGDSGAPYFVGAKDDLATWMEAESDLTLAPGERMHVPFSITVPAGAEPGGHFAAIFFGSQPAQNTGGGEVSIGGKVGVLILLRVSGPVAEVAGLQEFSAKDGKRVFNQMPVSLQYHLNNEGGDRIVPIGEVTIKNTLRLTSATLLANKNEGSVLPGSTRKFNVVWGEQMPNSDDASFADVLWWQLKNFHFGWYTANLNIAWGEAHHTAVASYHFFIFPWQLLSVFSAIFLVFGFFARSFIRRYNRFIVAQAMRQ